jgi:hypothetical protein
MTIEVAAYYCIKEGKGFIKSDRTSKIDLFDIEAKVSYPLSLNKENNFEHQSPTLEITAFYDKELLLTQSTELIELITCKSQFKIYIKKNQMSDFFNIEVIQEAKITGVDLNENKIYLIANDFKESNSIFSEEHN